jgi:hypothetical protein
MQPVIRIAKWAIPAAVLVGLLAWATVDPDTARLGYRRVEAIAVWLLRFPLFPLQVVLVLLVSWRLLGRGLGLERLIWHEKPLVQFGAGWAIAVLFGVLLFVRYLLYWPDSAYENDIFNTGYDTEPDFWLMDVMAPANPAWTLFPSTDGGVRRLGAFLLWGLIALGGALVVPKVVGAARARNPRDATWSRRVGRYVRSRRWLLPGTLGYASGLLFLLALSRGAEMTGVRVWIADRLGPFGGLPSWFVRRYLPEAQAADEREAPLQALAVLGVLAVIVLLVVLWTGVWILNRVRPGKALTSPFVFAALLLVALNLAYGAVVFQWWVLDLAVPWVVLIAVILAFAAWNSTRLFRSNHYTYRFPNLDAEHHALSAGGGGLNPLPCAAPPPGGLIPDQVPLRAIHDRWIAKHPGTKPIIVLFAVSGGGMRASVWTARVVEELERAAGVVPFREHTRLFAGASGGMVGATLYVSAFDHVCLGWQAKPTWEDAAVPLGWLSGALAEDCLTATIQTAVLRDLGWNLLTPPGMRVRSERGRTLEQKWGLSARARGLGAECNTPDNAVKLRRLALSASGGGPAISPFSRTFAELRPAEADGRRPSLILTPMMVEDSRRLIISNLDLSYLATPTGQFLEADVPVAYSRGGLELFKLFPGARSPGGRHRSADERVVPRYQPGRQPTHRPATSTCRCRVL